MAGGRALQPTHKVLTITEDDNQQSMPIEATSLYALDLKRSGGDVLRWVLVSLVVVLQFVIC